MGACLCGCCVVNVCVFLCVCDCDCVWGVDMCVGMCVDVFGALVLSVCLCV